MVHDHGFSGLELAKIEYVGKIVFGELTKLIILLSIFSLLGQLVSFIYIFIALSLFRPISGGIHMNTYIKCLTFTLFFFMVVLFCSQLLTLTTASLVIITISEITIIIIRVPVYGNNRPKLSVNRCNRFKVMGCVIILIHMLLFQITETNPYLQLAVWVHIYQIILLSLRRKV